MMIVECPCGIEVKAGDHAAGSFRKCPGCGGLVWFPRPDNARRNVPTLAASLSHLAKSVADAERPATSHAAPAARVKQKTSTTTQPQAPSASPATPSIPPRNQVAARACPYCGEKILAVAKKCRYCHEWLQEQKRSGGRTVPTKHRATWRICVLLVAPLLIYAAFRLPPVFTELPRGRFTVANSSAALESLFLPLAVAAIIVSLCFAYSWMSRSAMLAARRAVSRHAHQAKSPPRRRQPPQPIPGPKTAGSKPTPTSSNTDEFTACPNCGRTGSTWAGSGSLNIFYCKCGKVYCDQCSGGGNADLPHCPVSANHERRRKVRSISAQDQSAPPRQEVSKSKAGANAADHSRTLMAPLPSAKSEPTLREIMIFKAGARIRDEIWYIEQVIDFIGYSLKNLPGVHIGNIRYVTPDKLEQPYMIASLMKAGYDPCNCKLTQFEDRDGGRGLTVQVAS